MSIRSEPSTLSSGCGPIVNRQGGGGQRMPLSEDPCPLPRRALPCPHVLSHCHSFPPVMATATARHTVRWSSADHGHFCFQHYPLQFYCSLSTSQTVRAPKSSFFSGTPPPSLNFGRGFWGDFFGYFAAHLKSFTRRLMSYSPKIFERYLDEISDCEIASKTRHNFDILIFENLDVSSAAACA